MKNFLFLIISSLLFTSCASILNDKTYVVHIDSNEPNARVKVQDSIYTLPVHTEIKRSKQDLVFTLLKEPKDMEFRVKPKLSGKLLLNIFLLPSIYPALIAAPLDFSSVKSRHYGKDFYLNTKDSTVTVSKPMGISYGDYVPMKYKRKEGDLYLHLGLPYVNFFRSKPVGESTRTSWGFAGISLGIDYYHEKDQFINFSASAITDYELPFPGIVETEEGSPERNYSAYFGISNNHRLVHRLSLGYGLSYAYNGWTPGDGIYASNTTVTQNHWALGLLFPAYFQVGKTFNIGLVYRPTFYRLIPKNELQNEHSTSHGFMQTEQFQYEHLISIDFAWKIKL